MLYKQLCDGIYIGDEEAIKNGAFESSNIGGIINLTNEMPENRLVEVFKYVVHDQELMDNEIGKLVTKLSNMCDLIKDFRANGTNVFICCANGRNRAPLVAGYYLISQGQNYMHVIQMLESLYFTPEQFADENNMRHSGKISDELVARAHASAKARYELRCLNNRSYKKILRILGGAKS